MNHTPNLNLPQWDAGDFIQRTDFNAAMSAIDTAVAACGNCKIAVGSYTGDGQYGDSHPTVINAGFAVKLLVVISPPNVQNQRLLVAARGMSVVHSAFSNTDNDADGTNLIWGETSVSLYATHGGYNVTATTQFNQSGKVYHYIALG